MAAPQAVTIDFSAMLMPGTCTFSLSQSTLSLGTVTHSQLIAGKLLNIAPFTLNVVACSGSDSSLTPMVNITGEGMFHGGKWLFRSSDSEASGMGVMLTRTDSPPNYNQAEVKHGDDIPLAARGSVPRDQQMTFYAGVTCGNGSECTTQGLGELKARVVFNLEYR
ncbi:P pilus assembly protein, pilin FimA [Budvicia aquatica]|nr:P pilus assembly protein, pilin FimA [Budvicia aquatica]